MYHKAATWEGLNIIKYAEPIDNLMYEALHAHRIISIAGTKTGEPTNEYIKRETYWT